MPYTTHAHRCTTVARPSKFLSFFPWHSDMNPAFISAVMASNLKIKQITVGTRQSIPIPNHLSPISRGKSIQSCPTEWNRMELNRMELMGMESEKCVIKNGKYKQRLKRFNLYNIVKMFPNTGNQKGASPYPQPERGRSISPSRKGPCKKRGLGLRIKSGPKRCPPKGHGCQVPLRTHEAIRTATANTDGLVKWLLQETHILTSHAASRWLPLDGSGPC